jgi:hypothetical protein
MKQGTLIRVLDKPYIWKLDRGRLYWVTGMSRKKPGHLACESIYPDTLFKYAYPHPTHVEEVKTVKNLTKEELIQIVSQMRAQIEVLETRQDTHMRTSRAQMRLIEQLTVRVSILEGASDANTR